jgi:3-hydroxymyristoyl/3-hydroxydecanoyl-(acyl carrier protein) dehydratase
MAILWCHDQKGMASLPSYSESYRQYCRTFPQNGMTAVMEVRAVTDHKMTSDFTFLSRDNTVVATISGYEAVMDASLTGAFGKKGADEKKPSPLFDRDKLLAYAIGKPSDAFGKKYEVFDHGRILARLPGPPYFFMDSVTAIDHPAWELKPAGWIEASYTVPDNEWYFKANRSDKMPFCVLLEIALQPCGWLAAYAGSALHSDKQLKFRNLGGKAVLFREVNRNAGTLTMRTRLTKVSEAAGMIIEDFDIQILNDGELIYDGATNFGFFTNETMAQQVGIRNPEKIIFVPDAEALKNARSVTFAPEAPLTPDDADETPCAAAAMPSKALLMIDGIDCYIEDGGPCGLGYVQGYKIVDPDEWFFKAHFYQDPVCPGSLGIESFLQLIKFAALERFGDLKDTHAFEFITGSENEWLYRGQVIPRNKKVEVTALITSVTEGDAPEIIADGYLCVDGLLIYQMKQFGFRLAPLPQP